MTQTLGASQLGQHGPHVGGEGVHQHAVGAEHVAGPPGQQ
jgi:hypothetical protein